MAASRQQPFSRARTGSPQRRGGQGLRRRAKLQKLHRVQAADDKFASYAPTTAFLFPGQGAQYVGMAKELCDSCPAASKLFTKASDILGYDLLELCATGPKEKLDSTAISQPAIFVSSIAALMKLREEDEAAVQAADVAAGLSLGEYTALCFADALPFEDGVKLVKLRGESMQTAADAVQGAMVSVIGLDSHTVAALCEKANEEAGPGSVQIANYLCPGNYVVSGSVPGCEVVERIAKPEFKARMTVRLAVAGAFHTAYMAPAVSKLEEALASTPLMEPRIPVVSNVDAQPHSDPETIKALLAKQVTSPVQWETTLKTLLEKGVSKSFEVGPGNVIAGLMKRVDRKHPVTGVSA